MAGNKIRGITIELSADASGVLDAVKNVNTEIKNTNSELRDIENLLKFDPGNMDLLKQKTEALQDQLSNCNEKLDTLKKAQADMTANGVDENSEQYKALQREIIATEQEIDKLKDTAGSGSAEMAKISEVTGNIGSSMEELGGKMSIISGAIAALGTAAVAAFNEVDAGADIVITKTGATGEAAEELQEVYTTVAQSIVADFEDIGSAVGEVNTRFGLTGDELEDLSEEFLKFAEINGTDVSDSVDAVDRAMKTFGVDQSEVKNVMGKLTKTSQDTGISMDTLMGLLQSSGPTLKEMGLDLGESVTLMGNFESAGLDSNEMLGKMSKAAAYFQEKGMDMNEGLSDLIARLQDSDTAADATAEAYELFGSKAGLAFVTAAQEGKLNISDLEGSMDDYGTVVDDTYQETLDGTDQMKLAWQNLQVGMAEIGEAIGNVLAPIMDKITQIIQGITSWFNGLNEDSQNLIVTIGLVVAAIGPLLVVGGKVMTGLSNITGALSKIGTSTTGPIGLVIVATAALVAGLLTLKDRLSDAYQKASPYTDELNRLKDANNQLNDSISNTKSTYENTATATEAEAGAARNLKEKLFELIKGYDGTQEKQLEIQGTVDALNKIVPDLGLSWDEVTNSLNMTNDEISANIELMRTQAQVAALQDYYTESLKEQYEAEKNLKDAAYDMTSILGDYGISLQDVTDYVTGGTLAQAAFQKKLLDNGVAFFDLGNATDEVIKAYNNLGQAGENVTRVNENVEYAEEELTKAMQEAANASATTTAEIVAAYENNLGTAMPESLKTAITAATDAGVKIPSELRNGIISGKTSVKDACDQLAALTDETKTAQQNGKSTGEAYTNATATAVDSGASNVSKAANNAVDELDMADEAYEYGSGTGESYDEGLASTEGGIANTASDIADDVADEIDDLPAEMQESGSESGSELNSGFGNWKGTISDTVDETYDFFYNTLGTMLPPLMSQWGSDSSQKFNSGLKIWESDISDTAQRIESSIESALSPLPTEMYNVGYNGGSSMYNGLSFWSSYISSLTSNIVTGAYNAATFIGDWMYTIGYNAGVGIYNGLGSWSTAIYNLAMSIAKSINDAAEKALDIGSPSRVLAKIGRFAGEGLEIGLEESGKGVLEAASDIADGITDTLNVGTLNTGFEELTASGSSVSVTASIQGFETATATLVSVLNLLDQYMPYVAADRDINFDDGAWAGRLAPSINRALESINNMEARG